MTDLTRPPGRPSPIKSGLRRARSVRADMTKFPYSGKSPPPNTKDPVSSVISSIGTNIRDAVNEARPMVRAKINDFKKWRRKGTLRPNPWSTKAHRSK